MRLGSSLTRSANDLSFTRSNTIPQRSPTSSTPQTAGTGSAIASTAAWIAASLNAVGFLAEER
jgi:hypothetical protein